MAAELHVVHLKIQHRATGLTPPSVATQDLLAQTFVRQRIQPQAGGFWSNRGEEQSPCCRRKRGSTADLGQCDCGAGHGGPVDRGCVRGQTAPQDRVRPRPPFELAAARDRDNGAGESGALERRLAKLEKLSARAADRLESTACPPRTAPHGIREILERARRRVDEDKRSRALEQSRAWLPFRVLRTTRVIPVKTLALALRRRGIRREVRGGVGIDDGDFESEGTKADPTAFLEYGIRRFPGVAQA